MGKTLIYFTRISCKRLGLFKKNKSVAEDGSKLFNDYRSFKEKVELFTCFFSDA